MEKHVFSNYGGSYQLDIKTPGDLAKILDMDEALWAAASIPLNILNIDRKFLEYLDSDKNGRIRTDEIKSAISWLLCVLKDYSHISGASDALSIESINGDIPEGKILVRTAKRILSNLKASDNSDKITLSQVRNLQGIMASSATNGDGVITPDDTSEEEISALIKLIIEITGGTADASGKQGISIRQADDFFTNASLFLEWSAKGKIPPGQEKTEIMVWGAGTPAAYECLKKIEPKMNEFFTQCAIAGFDGRVKNSLKLTQKELEETDFTDTKLVLKRLAKAPLAEIDDEGTLRLNGYINPVFADAVNSLRRNVIEKALGKNTDRLTQKQWETVKSIFAVYGTYLDGKKGGAVESVGEEILRKYTEGALRDKINALIEKDIAAAKQIQHIQDVEKLILFQKYMLEFANNSASFANVYNPGIRSIFEAGTLVIDGRKITFTLLVSDRNIHKNTARDSNVYLMYLDITGRHNGESKFGIAAAVTSGDSGTLRIGKRGVFFTRDGREWDAEVTDIVINPIGLLESVKTPFIKLSDAIRNQVEKFAKTREARIQTTLVAPSGASMARDLLVGGGVAIAALGSSFAYVTKAVSQVKPVHFFITIGLILSIVLLPSLVMGIIKLRRRNLSILFEASGCAINVKMRLTVWLGRLFTYIPPYPAGSRKKKIDIVAQLAAGAGGKTRGQIFRRMVKIALATIIICIIAAALLFLRLRYSGRLF
ncbi:MAG: hypothetical protein JW957_05240 [Candidatus Omnitrophica bacterium]|nr:hypothetical protein [Candidatus Omnitrophota bacterium]